MESAHNYLRTSNLTNAERADWIANGIEILKSDQISCLKIIETGTTGLTEEHWEALIEMEGGAYKNIDNPGGSFGIGKTAVFALSELRSVIYSTLYVNGLQEGRVERATGKSRLITHPDPNHPKEQLQHIGFWRAAKGTREPIIENDIPDTFRLSTIGSTGIYILGCKLPDNWIKQVVESVIDNFFAAIHSKHLVVSVYDDEKNTTIDNENLHSIFFDNASLTKNHEYYRALRDKDAIQLHNSDFCFTELSDGFKIQLYLTIHENDDFHRGIATINRKGMFITSSNDQKNNPFAIRSSSSWKPFTLLVKPSNDQTDKWLRQLEPPSHDRYDIGRGPVDLQNNIYTMFQQVRRDIKNIIDLKLGVGKTEVVNVDALSHLLPDTNLTNDDHTNSMYKIINISSRPQEYLYQWPDNEPTNTEMIDDLEDYDLDNETPDDPHPTPPPGPDDPDSHNEVVTDQITSTQREHRRSFVIHPRVIPVRNNHLRIFFTLDPEFLPDAGVTSFKIFPQGDKLLREKPLQIIEVTPEDISNVPASLHLNAESNEVLLEINPTEVVETTRMAINVILGEEADYITSLTPVYTVVAR